MKAAMKRVFLMVIPVILLTGCQYKSKAYQSLEQQKDSLLLEEQKKMAEINQMLSVINLVEENFQQIKDAENYVTFQANQEEVQVDSLSQMVQDVELIRKTLVENKAQITSLKHQLAQSKAATGELKRLVARLTAEVDDHVRKIADLQEKLAMKDIRIKELDELVLALGDSISSLQEKVTDKEAQLNRREQEMNKVWYVFGTKKELREQEIYTRNGLLEEGFDKMYFMEADARTLTDIPLYARKAKVLTNHPASSYRFDKVNEYLVLHILDPKKFWEISRYLVVQVD
jgi:DNA repair exonuclease SbcCD ATPase subunit